MIVEKNEDEMRVERWYYHLLSTKIMAFGFGHIHFRLALENLMVSHPSNPVTSRYIRHTWVMMDEVSIVVTITKLLVLLRREDMCMPHLV